MRYRIMKGSEEVNIIVSDETFVSDYCKKNGYTFETITVPPDPKQEPEPTTEEVLLEIAADHEERLCLMELGI